MNTESAEEVNLQPDNKYSYVCLHVLDQSQQNLLQRYMYSQLATYFRLMQGQQKQSGCSSFGRTSFSQGKIKLNFYKKATIDRKSISRGARLSATHALNLLLCSQGILLCKKPSNKQNESVILDLLGLQHYYN